MARNGHGRYYGGSVMNTGESEGSDSSGRVDMEINGSEDFSIPIRKCVSSNLNRQDAFDIPTQVLPLSGISRTQRKGLLLRLRAELEQVIVFQKKSELQRTNRPSYPSSSNIHSSNNIQNGNRTDNLQRLSMEVSAPGKILNSQKKKGTAGKLESVRQTLVSNGGTLILTRQCEPLLKRLMSHQFGWIFNNPVDVVALNLPDYFTVIKQPMDLGTIKGKLANGVYYSPLEFAADVRLTFSNAKTYNPPGNDVHIMADTMSKFFEARWKSIEKKVPVTDTPIVPERSGISEGTETAKPVPPSKRRKIVSLQQHFIPEPTVERIMTDAEKINLGRELESLLAELPDRIVDFLRENSSNGTETGDDEIEIDIDEFSDDKLFRLRKLIDEYLEEKEKNHAKGEPCEIELLNEPGLSNSSMQPCKGAVDEDVDIGGNEPPVSSYPPIEIDKDSDTEADGAKPSMPVNVAKVVDPVETETQPDGKSSVDDHSNGNKSASGVNQLVVKVQHAPNSVESDYSQDGDSAATAMQVSPNKLYRAALLKNRFADTILKAREKTLVQDEKKDPEKRKREKEELEIQRRKEKARLQAEAKAAEDSRRRAEAEAVLEAKRKREAEREAARQALLKIEKTVEMNENSQFLKDLEMLRSATVEPLPIPVNETSPEHSQDGLGGFNFGGSNPLEQLGLYMRNDDEEEEGEPHNIPNPLELLGLYMKKGREDKEEEEAGSPNTMEQHALHMKNGDEEEEGDPPGTGNTLEQLGLYLKKDDDEEGELPSIPNTLDQFGLYMKKDDDEEDELPSNPNTLEQLGSQMEIDDDKEEGELPSRPETLEQIGLYMRNDDKVEQVEASLDTSKQLGSYMKMDDEEEEGELSGTPNDAEELSEVTNTFEQLELPMVKDDEEQGEPPNTANSSEQFALPAGKDNVEEQPEPPSIPNTLEQLELPTGKDEKEEPTVQPSNQNTLEQPEHPTGKGDEDEKLAPPSIPNTLEQLGSNMETDDDVETKAPGIPNTLEQLGSNMETEVPSIRNTLEQPAMSIINDDEEVQVEIPSSPKNFEQPDLAIRNDIEQIQAEVPTVPNVLEQPEHPTGMGDEDVKSDPPRVPNTLEQLGSNMETDDDVETEIPSIPNTLEQPVMSIIKDGEKVQVEISSIPENIEQVDLSIIKDSEEVQAEVPSVPNTSEQLDLSARKDEHEEVQAEVPNVPITSEQLDLSARKDEHEEVQAEVPDVPIILDQRNVSARQDEHEEVQAEVPDVPITLDQLNVSARQDEHQEIQTEVTSVSGTEKGNEEEQADPPSIPNTLIQPALSNTKDDEHAQEPEPPSVPNTQLESSTKNHIELASIPDALQQLGMYTEEDEVDESDLPTIPNPMEQDNLLIKNDDRKLNEASMIQPDPSEQLQSSLKTTINE